MFLLICVYLICIVSSNVIQCIGSYACQDQTLTCNHGEFCSIICEGSFACVRATLNCPENADCSVTCTKNKKACQLVTLNCPINGNCNIYGGCSESNTFVGAHIWCPIESGLCTFECNQQKGCTDATIHGGAGDLIINAALSGRNYFDRTKIYCPKNKFCNITINSTTDYSSFQNTKIYAINASHLNIKNIGGGGQRFLNSIIQCPFDGRIGNTNNCNIELNGNTIYDLENVQIITEEGINDINLKCDTQCYSNMANRTQPILFCNATGTDKNCSIHSINTNYNQWECIDNANICNDYSLPSFSPSRYPTTPYPSTSPTTSFPSYYPTNTPTYYPTHIPTYYPTNIPTYYPSQYPSQYPTTNPTTNPTLKPTKFPTYNPVSSIYITLYPLTKTPTMTNLDNTNIGSVKIVDTSTTISDKEENIIYVNSNNENNIFTIVLVFSCIVLGLCAIIIGLIIWKFWIKKSKGKTTSSADLEMKPPYSHSENIG
eukprot:116238_1